MSGASIWPLRALPLAGLPRARPLLVLVLLEAALTAGLVVAGREVATAAALLIAGGSLVAALLVALPPRERDPLLVLFAAGFLLRTTALVVLHTAWTSPANAHGFLFRDSFGYDRVGWNIAEHWQSGRPARIAYQTAGFTIGYHYFVAAVYTLVGHAPLVLKSLNVLLSACLVPLTFLLGRRLAGREVGLFAAFWIAVWPPVIFWSAQLLKDVVIAFLLLVAAVGWTAFARRPRLDTLALTLLPAIPLVFLRTYMFLFWMIGVAVGLFALARARRQTLLAVLLAGAVAVAGLIGALEYSALRLRSLEVWVAKLSATGTMRTSLFSEVFYRSLGDIIAFYPKGVIHFLLTPLPWRTDLLHVAEAVGSVLRYALLPFAACGLVHLFRKERSALLPVLVTIFLAVSLFAVAFRGGGPRHMTQLYPFFLVFAAAGRQSLPNWPLPVAAGWVGLLVAAAALGLT